MRPFLVIALLIMQATCMTATAQCGILPENFLEGEELDLFCLRLSYPQIKSVTRDNSGAIWLKLENGKKIPYRDSRLTDETLNSDLKGSMKLAYPLEPARPIPQSGQSPGRKRPYELFYALYGESPANMQTKLKTVRFEGSALRMATHAAESFERAKSQLETIGMNSSLKKYLKPDGAYYWRNIAGEPWPSAHSFGIAVDLGSKIAPYWRWSKQMPHPLQKSYPPEIVEAMERHGFIWGGKWHEYDLMHFEYRPEILCKARMQKHMKKI